jgi:hypothetical protein
MSKKKEFSYVIGFYWTGDEGSIATYRLFNDEVMYGTLKEAKKNLKHIQKEDRDANWKIFELKELEE